jgi:hypothetical protein
MDDKMHIVKDVWSCERLRACVVGAGGCETVGGSSSMRKKQTFHAFFEWH